MPEGPSPLAPRPASPRSNLWLRPAARSGCAPRVPAAPVSRLLGVRPGSSPSSALSQPGGCLFPGRAPFLIPRVPVPVPLVPQPALTLLFLAADGVGGAGAGPALQHLRGPVPRLRPAQVEVRPGETPRLSPGPWPPSRPRWLHRGSPFAGFSPSGVQVWLLGACLCESEARCPPAVGVLGTRVGQPRTGVPVAGAGRSRLQMRDWGNWFGNYPLAASPLRSGARPAAPGRAGGCSRPHLSGTAGVGWGGKGKMGLKGFWRSAPNRCVKLLPPLRLDLSRR